MSIVDEVASRSDEPEWLLTRRREAWRTYRDLPLPSPRDEAWRRTDSGALSLDRIALLPPKDGAPGSRPWLRLDGAGYGGRLVEWGPQATEFEQAPGLARQGVILSDLGTAAREHRRVVQKHLMTEAVLAGEWKYLALHAALREGGALVYAPKNAEASLPLYHAVCLERAGVARFPHTLVVAEAGSSVMLVEEYASAGRGRALVSGAVEVLVGEGARVRYVGLQDWGRRVDSFLTLRALVDAGGRFELITVNTGGRNVRAEYEAVLRGRGASAFMTGLVLAGDEQRLDIGTLQDHRALETVSDLLLKSVLTDKARFAWRGWTRVHRAASGAEANQTGRSLLLSDQAKATPMPVLEIEAHDVERCSHGATVSSVDDEQLFYLMSRGLSREAAAHAIVEGFFRQGLDTLGDDGLRRTMMRALRRKLTRGARGAAKGQRWPDM